MPSTLYPNLKFSQPVLRSAGSHTNATAQQPATGGGGGGPPTGAAGGDLSGHYPNPTLAAIGSATGPIGSTTTVPVVTIDAKGRVTALTSATIPAVVGFIYPETYGAVGNGSTDDTSAVQSAATAAAAAGKILFLSLNYGLSATVNVNCPVFSISTAGFTAVTNNNFPAITISGLTNQNNLRMNFGFFFGFSGTGGAAVYLNATAVKLDIQKVGSCKSAVLFGNSTIDCDINVMLVGTCTYVFNVNAPALGFQGNYMRCVFATTCNYGVYYNGAAGAGGDANEAVFVAWDSNTASSPSIFYNSSITNACYNWLFRAETWVGAAGGGWTTGSFASGAFIGCNFYIGNGPTLAGSNTNTWDFFNLVGQNNSVEGGYRSGTVNTTTSWQGATNNRTAFSSTAYYFNCIYCTGTGPAGGIAAGASITVYVYTPFCLARLGSSWAFRASGLISTGNLTAANGAGMVCAQIFDNSSTVDNEIILTFTNTSSTAVGASVAFNFFFFSGR